VGGDPGAYNKRMAFRNNQLSSARKGKTPPPEDTHEEAAYLKTLGERQKPVSIKLIGGEVMRGWIEYYDRDMIRLTREGAPNLFIFKHDILYICEGTLKDPARRTRTAKAAVNPADSHSPNGSQA
jgi:host factor-I protein